jgi:hypothetical protein
MEVSATICMKIPCPLPVLRQCPLYKELFNRERIIILDDRLLYFLSTAIVILIVIVITIKLYDQKNEIY